MYVVWILMYNYYMIYIFRVFSDKLLKKHTTSLAELIKRDKNRPSVIMWSIANEPRSDQLEADSYFK